MQRTCIIMAGGSGERFWPLSRKAKPKQLLPLTESGKALIAEAIERISSIIPPQDIFIITSELLLHATRIALPDFPPENIIAEPAKRNTAPCLALAAAFLMARYNTRSPNEISVAVLTADHKITPTSEFQRTVEVALSAAENTGALAVIGISPTRPETGYGYIEIAAKTQINFPVKAARFCEKPNIDDARKFLDSGNFYWNSGMFFWRLDAFISEITAAIPIYYNKIIELKRAYSQSNRLPLNESEPSARECFNEFSDISIDYGLMERSNNVILIPAGFDWDDVGAWDALDRLRKADADGNIIYGDNIANINNLDSIILNNSSQLAVSVIGIKNLAVIVTDDAVLVCPKNRAQDVKKAVAYLQNNGGEKYL